MGSRPPAMESSIQQTSSITTTTCHRHVSFTGLVLAYIRGKQRVKLRIKCDSEVKTAYLSRSIEEKFLSDQLLNGVIRILKFKILANALAAEDVIFIQKYEPVRGGTEARFLDKLAMKCSSKKSPAVRPILPTLGDQGKQAGIMAAIQGADGPPSETCRFDLQIPRSEPGSDDSHVTQLVKLVDNEIESTTGSLLMSSYKHVPQTCDISSIEELKVGMRTNVKGTVRSKTTPLKYATAKDEGHLFTFDLEDRSGVVRVTFFKDVCWKFWHLLAEGSSYVLRNVLVKHANRKFVNLPHPCEVTSTGMTDIISCTNYTQCNHTIFNRVPLSRIPDTPERTFIDVIAVVCDVEYTPRSFRSTRKSKTYEILRLYVVDDSAENLVPLVVFGDQVEKVRKELQHSEECQTVISARGLRVVDFNGRKGLCAQQQTLIKVLQSEQEMIQRCLDLYRWYRSKQCNSAKLPFMSLNDIYATSMYAIKLMDALQVLPRRMGESKQFLCSVVFGTFETSRQSIFYMACPTPNCFKKLFECGQDTRAEVMCPKCNAMTTYFITRYHLKFRVKDDTASLDVDGFEQAGYRLFRKSAENLDNMHHKDHEQFIQLIQIVESTPYLMRFEMVMTEKYGLRTTVLYVGDTFGEL